VSADGCWWALALPLLAQAEEAAREFRPFYQPLPVWDYWYLLLLPLCLGISIVYKSIKVRTMSQMPREAAVIFVMILLGMILAAGALFALTRIMEKT
jgi:hypothetical protein